MNECSNGCHFSLFIIQGQPLVFNKPLVDKLDSDSPVKMFGDIPRSLIDSHLIDSDANISGQGLVLTFYCHINSSPEVFTINRRTNSKFLSIFYVCDVFSYNCACIQSPYIVIVVHVIIKSCRCVTQEGPFRDSVSIDLRHSVLVMITYHVKKTGKSNFFLLWKLRGFNSVPACRTSFSIIFNTVNISSTPI